MYKLFAILALSATLLIANERPSLVWVDTIKKQSVSSIENFTGTVTFAKSAKISVEGAGKVKNTLFQTGDYVVAGEPLLHLDTQILDSKIASAKAAVDMASVELNQAKTDFKRFKNLIDQNSIAKKTYEDSKFNFQARKAALKGAKSSLQELLTTKEKATLYAPFDGVISTKNVQKGEWVASGSVIANLVNTKDLEILFYLPTHFANSLDVGNTYEVVIGGNAYLAKLHAMIPKGDTITRRFPAKFTLSVDDFVFEGMEAVASLPSQKELKAYVVPRDAVINRFDGMVIFVVEDDKAQLRPVEILGYSTDSIAIKAEGIKEGMQVVTKGNERIFPDSAVTVRNR